MNESKRLEYEISNAKYMYEEIVLLQGCQSLLLVFSVLSDVSSSQPSLVAESPGIIRSFICTALKASQQSLGREE